MTDVKKKINTHQHFILKEAVLVFLKMLLVNIAVGKIILYLPTSGLGGQAGIIVLALSITVQLTFFILFMFESCFKFYLRLKAQSDQ